MGYNLKSLKDELVSKNLADYGLVAWGQKSIGGLALFGAIGGAIGGATSPKFVISMVENSKIAVFPFTNKEIKYNEGKAFDKSKITSAKVSGMLSKQLIINTYNGQTFKYPIMQGVQDVKDILHRLGL